MYFFIQVEYGQLKACFTPTSTNNNYCIVQLFEKATDGNQPIVNEQNCPLLLLLKVLKVVPSHSIRSVVSVIHQCGNSCKFEACKYSRKVEREDVQIDGLILKHDLTNTMFCLNIYCMKCV